MNSKYNALFTPWKIGNVEIPNRIVQCSMGGTSLFGWMEPSHLDKEAAYFLLNRAQDGVGLILPGMQCIKDPIGGRWLYQNNKMFKDLKEYMVEFHKTGSKLFIQLAAGMGRSMAITKPMVALLKHPILGKLASPVADLDYITASASATPNRWYDEIKSRPMTIKEIHDQVEAFAKTSKKLMDAGVDGVEIHAVHEGYLLDQFTISNMNYRTDEYGGSLDARMRFLLEVIAEIRERCGKDFIIDVRISGDEYTDGGLTLNDMIYVSRRLEKAGVDMIHVSGGTTIKRGSAIPAAGTQQASHAACSREIKKHVNIPVATVGRINEAWIAEELIEDGAADICMMGRANLCDAEFCNKAAAGNADDIRPCIGCLRCLNGIMFGKRISCTVNPDVERDEAGYEPAAEAKNVLVVGAGPAGMEAAYIAAKRGHNVVLVDKQDEPGGEMRIAAVPPAKQELTRVIKYQYRRLAEAGVKCVFGTELTAEDIQHDYAGYEVVLAYGAEPIAPAFMQGFKQVMTADDLLGGKAFPGKKIVIVGGGPVGCETADYLAPLVNDLSPANRDVTVIEMTKTLAANEGGAGRAVLITRMLSKGVHVLTEAKVTEITEDTISYEKDGEVHTIADADTLVLAMGYRPNTKLADDLAAAGVAVHVLGDAQKCGNIRDAIGDGYKVACEL